MRLFPLFRAILRDALDADGKKIVNLATPTQDADAANKAYVDENAGGSPSWDDIRNKPETFPPSPGKLPLRPLPKYLHYLPFDDAYPADSAWLYSQLGPSDMGRCSAVRRGGKLWRNYDRTFDDAAEFVVRMSGNASRFASVGVASVGARLTENEVMSAVNSRYYKCLPGMTLDGINEKGVVCVINVDGGQKTGWHGTGANAIHILAAVRWALDHGESAQQAADWLADHIIQPTGDMNFHFMVADATKTYIVENGEAHDVTDGVKVLTNYALYDEAHAGGGKERYQLLASGENIAAVNFTNAYQSGNDWHSDFESEAQHAAAIEQWAEQGADKEAHRGRTTTSGNAWWQSAHTTEYDFAAKAMKVAVQESNDWYTFAVDAVTANEILNKLDSPNKHGGAAFWNNTRLVFADGAEFAVQQNGLSGKQDLSVITALGKTHKLTEKLDATDSVLTATAPSVTASETALAGAKATGEALEEKYEKPSDGIPKTDLDTSVQNSLGLADSALQSLPSHTHTRSEISDFPNLATVATSGSYADLSNKPQLSDFETAGYGVFNSGAKTYNGIAGFNEDQVWGQHFVDGTGDLREAINANRSALLPPAFAAKTSGSYEQGELVIYNNVAYKRNSTAGADTSWVASHWTAATDADLAARLKNLKSDGFATDEFVTKCLGKQVAKDAIEDEKTRTVFDEFARMDAFTSTSTESDSFDVAITKLSQLLGENVAA